MLLWSQDFWGAQEDKFSHLVSGNQEIFLTRNTQTIASGFIGPYGGPKPDHGKNDPAAIEQILLDTIQFARVNSGTHIEIRLPPRDFYPNYLEVMESSLSKLGFRVKYVDINSSIKVSNFSEIGINRNRKRDLKFWKSIGATYSYSGVSLSSVFDCLSENRKNRNIPPSLNLPQLNKLAEFLGNRFSTHAITFNQEVVCAAVVLKLDKDIQYVFMWGDNPATRTDYPSPITFLLEGMTGFFSSDSDVRICLGTSSRNGEVDASLLQFKNSLGFPNTEKPTYILKL
jgi:hypothetical protein